jgi:formylglycine-generating enzyme required for sulfatase activity/tRNA A-37 threonylcarbamoyl transferase component Bud32
MSVVFHAFDKKQKREVAIKRLPPKWRDDQVAQIRFHRESATQQRAQILDGVVQILDYRCDEYGAYIVSEWMAGGSLSEFRRSGNRPLNWQEACRICSHVATTMQAVHDLKIVHRDIKPGNILLAADGTPMISDFGIVRISKETDERPLTETAEQLGTPGFQSPEQRIDASRVDFRADIWSLGATLHYLIAGLPVKIDSSAAEVRCDQDVLDALRVPKTVRDIIRKSVAYRPCDRFQKMSDFSAALSATLETSPVQPREQLQRSRLSLLATIVSVAAAGLAVWSITQHRSPPLPEVAPTNKPQPSTETEMASPSAGLSTVQPPVEITIRNIPLVRIDAGHFSMGLPPEMTGQPGPQPRVEITHAFYIGETEITQRQWTRVMQTEPWRDQPSAGTDPEAPANYVSWHDAVDFCDRLSTIEGRRVRLPTEAEWEFASRAGAVTRWSFGDDEARSGLASHAWFEENSTIENPQKVAQKQRNPCGLFDTYGNVEEWCSDWFDPRWSARSQPVDPVGPLVPASGSPLKVLRGGSWKSGALNCSSVFRNYAPPGSRSASIGFRIVLEDAAASRTY